MQQPGAKWFAGKGRYAIMNKALRYVGIICLLVALFSLSNYYSYQSAIKHFEEMQEDYESRLGEQVEVYVSNEMADQMEEMKQELSEAVTTQQNSNVLSEEAVYRVQSYNCLTQTTTTDYRTLPEKLAGCDREEAESYCTDYMNDMPVEEFLDGLQSMKVISFSNDSLTVLKTYDISQIKYRYYLIADQGEVVVYYGDMKNVYERTGISVDSLSKSDKKALKNGIEVKDEEELFGILENFSS